ncbi:MAG: hypothetical protein JRN45_00545 [Nitrososphaerota archaeon]|nr:hypothetical protein [Nitrososphaerota archaeon]
MPEQIGFGESETKDFTQFVDVDDPEILDYVIDQLGDRLTLRGVVVVQGRGGFLVASDSKKTLSECVELVEEISNEKQADIAWERDHGQRP